MVHRTRTGLGLAAGALLALAAPPAAAASGSERAAALIELFVQVMTAVAAPVAPVDVNRADPGTLAAGLPGVDAALAREIVAWRERHGPFRDVEDLLRIPGIARGAVLANRERLRFGAPPPSY